MRYTTLGDTGLLVSRLSLGAMTFGHSEHFAIGKLGREESASLLDRAIDSGINFIDTADVYAQGDSERILGELLGPRRQELVVATKVGNRMGGSLLSAGLSRQHIFNACDASLERLRTDYIDLYIVHMEDQLTPLEETLEALNDLVRAGKVRHLGFSNWPAWKAAQAVQMQRERGWARFCSAQLYYSVAGRDVEHDLIPFLEYNGLGLTAWSPLAGGLLSGKYSREELFDKSVRDPDTRLAALDFLPFDADTVFRQVEVLKEIGASHAATPAQVALAWLLAKPVVHSVIIGASKPAQLEDNLGAADLVLSAEEVARLDELGAPAPLYPNWFTRVVADRKRHQALGR